MPDGSKTGVTVLGLGAMGTALAEAFLAGGHPTTVWNRSAGKAEPLVAKGAVLAATPAEAIAANGVVVACLFDAWSVHEVLGAGAASLPGRVLVNLTNGTPGEARELAAWVAERDVEFLDGGIMAVPPMIGSPAAFVLYSGSQGAFDANRELLDSLGESMYYGADPGLAALHDFALLSGMYGMFMGVLQAFALIGSEGSEARPFAPLLKRWITSMSGFIDGAAEQIDKRDYTIGVVSNLAMQAGAGEAFAKVGEEQSISSELLAPLQPLMRRRVADGYGHEDITGIIELLKIKK
jgi:3-hydroxyisobutyrate dehydrogenase-like beta-hydroxyacid dehydrogenase